MTATESLFNQGRPVSQNSSVQKLERISKNLHSLRTKLSSYTCEPKTFTLYEIKEQLKSKLDKMSRSNQDLLKTLKSKKAITDQTKSKAAEQLNAFKNLENKVLDYIRRARLHC